MRLCVLFFAFFISSTVLAQSPISPNVVDQVAEIIELISQMEIEEINSTATRRSMRRLMRENLPLRLDRNLAEVLAETYQLERELAWILENIATSNCQFSEEQLSSIRRDTSYSQNGIRLPSTTGRLTLMTRINLSDETHTRSFRTAPELIGYSRAYGHFVRQYAPALPDSRNEEYCNSIREGTDMTNARYQANRGATLVNDFEIPLENICSDLTRRFAAIRRGSAAYRAADPTNTMASDFLVQELRGGRLTEEQLIGETWELILNQPENLDNILRHVGPGLSFEGQTDLVASIMGRLNTRWENGRDTGSRAYTCEEMLANLKDSSNTQMGVCRDMHLCGARMLVALNPAFRDHAFTVSFPTVNTYHTVLVAEDPNNPNSTRIINYDAINSNNGATGATLLSNNSSILDTGGTIWVHDSNGNMVRTVESNRQSLIRELTRNPNTRETENTNIFPSVAQARYRLDNGSYVSFSTATLPDGDILVLAGVNGETQVQDRVVAESENTTLTFARTRGFAVGAAYGRQELDLAELSDQTRIIQNTANLYARLESHLDLQLTAGDNDEHRLRFRLLGFEALADGGYVRTHDEHPGLLDPTQQGFMGSGAAISSTGVDYRYQTPNVELNLAAQVEADHITVNVAMDDDWGVPALHTASANASVDTRHQIDASNIIRASVALGLLHSNIGSYSEAEARLCLDHNNIGLCIRGQARIPLANCTSLISGGCNLLMRESVEFNVRRPSGSSLSVGAEAIQSRGMHNADGQNNTFQIFLSTTPP